MHTQPIHEVLAEAIVGRHLLTHPFYRRWEAGTLTEGELAAYAEQYRHIERELPVTLAAIADALPPGHARELVEANLADELGSPEPHAELFESFARAAGAAAGRAGHALDGGLARRRAHDGVERPRGRLGHGGRLRGPGRRHRGLEGRRAAPPLRLRRRGHPLLGRAPHPGGGPRRVVDGGADARWRPTPTWCRRPRPSRPTRGGSSSASAKSWRRSAHAADAAQLSVPRRPAASAKAAERSR